MADMLDKVTQLVAESLGIDLGTILIQLVGILVMFLVIKKYLWGPITDNIEKRREYVETQVKDAEANNEKALVARDKYENSLQDAKVTRREIIAKARLDAKLEGEKIINKSKDDAKLETEKAVEIIEREKATARQDLQKETLDIAFDIASKIVEKEVKKDEHEDVVKNFLKEVDSDAS